MNGDKTFIAGATQLGYLHYSHTRDEIEYYVKSYAGRIGQVTAFFKQCPEGRNELTNKIKSLELLV